MRNIAEPCTNSLTAGKTPIPFRKLGINRMMLCRSLFHALRFPYTVHQRPSTKIEVSASKFMLMKHQCLLADLVFDHRHAANSTLLLALMRSRFYGLAASLTPRLWY